MFYVIYTKDKAYKRASVSKMTYSVDFEVNVAEGFEVRVGTASVGLKTVVTLVRASKRVLVHYEVCEHEVCTT